MTAALIVTYPDHDGARFDRDYYVATHLPLVRDRLKPHGLIDATGYFPDQPGAWRAMAVLTFRDADARAAALASPDAAPIFADIPNFTDLQAVPAQAHTA